MQRKLIMIDHYQRKSKIKNFLSYVQSCFRRFESVQVANVLINVRCSMESEDDYQRFGRIIVSDKKVQQYTFTITVYLNSVEHRMYQKFNWKK